MEGTLLVTPEKLISTSEEFASSASNVQATTQEMLDLIKEISGKWIGEASSAYTTKFNALEEDMNQMYRMITEHSTDLNEMAANYQAAESANESTAGSLNTDAIS